jgi:hypothetical protein
VIGQLSPEKFVQFRKIVATNQYNRFTVRKEELLAERIKALKSKNEPMYIKMI